MRALAIVPLLALGACGGAFTTDPGGDAALDAPIALDVATTLDAAAPKDAPIEAAVYQDGALWGDEEAARWDAERWDAEPAQDAAPPQDAAPTCAPVVWTPPTDGSTQGPFAGCLVNEAPSMLIPGSYAVQLSRINGCFLEQTPLACRCASTYSCACLMSSPNTFCTGANLITCNDSLGAPIITCN